MKKILSILVAAVVVSAMSVSVCATEINETTPEPKSANTAITFNVDPTYTITIPETITLDKKTENGVVSYEKDIAVTADAGMRLVENKNVTVKMEGDFVLTSQPVSVLPYTVTLDNTTAPIVSGDTIATFTTNVAEQESILHVAANDPTYAGNYSDTVTFVITAE